MSKETLRVEPAKTWSDDQWYLDQNDRDIKPNDGFWVIGEGSADGRLLGGNLCTLNLLHGTDYMPEIEGSVLFIEDDLESMPHTFDRDLTSLVQQPGFGEVRGLLIGRFQESVGMTEAKLRSIIGGKQELHGLPILANVDFGHTDPIMTLPVGGEVHVEARQGASHFEVSCSG